MNKDLTIGNPSKVLWLFCLPLFGSVIFQQLYNIADSFVAGKFISDEALAAVGNSYEITLIFIAFGFGCNIGCSVITSELFGAKDMKGVKSAVSTSMISTGIICVILMALGLVFSTPLLKLINTPAEIFADSELYLRIYILGLPFVFFYNVSNGIFSALGDSKTPFIFLVCSSLSNIAADIWFVAGFGMGVDGVAWATFMCQGISCILSLIVVMKRLKKIECGEKSEVFSFELLKKISKVAIPSILQQSFISVGNIIIQGVINGFGAQAIAGYAASVKLNNMLITALTTLGTGLSNYTAQNKGAKKYGRINAGFITGWKMVWIICLPVALLFFLASKWILLLFLDNPTGEAMMVGIRFLKILSPFYFVVSIKLVTDAILRGSGLMKQFMIATFADLTLRVVFSIILSKTSLGTTGIWLSWPIGWTIAAGMSLFFYLKSGFAHRPSEKADDVQ